MCNYIRCEFTLINVCNMVLMESWALMSNERHLPKFFNLADMTLDILVDIECGHGLFSSNGLCFFTNFLGNLA